MADNKGNYSNNTPSNWEDAADKPAPKKERKPLKLNKNTQEFNPNASGQGSFQPGSQSGGVQQLYQQGFQPGFQQGFQPGFQQGFQPNYQQGFNQGGFPNNQPEFQQGFPGNQQGFNPNQQSQSNPVNNQTQPPPNTQTKPPTAAQEDTKPVQQVKPSTTKPKEPEPKKEVPKETQIKKESKKPEPKPEPAKKESKKGGKLDKKTGSDAQGKKKDDKNELEKSDQTERTFTKLQNLLANQKNTKADKFDLESILKDKSKYDDLVDEEREPLNIVFIGHVDAGKSTTCGNILILTGQVDQNDVRKLKQEAKENHRESWWMAYLMDIGDEEKAKGKTVEVGKARFNLKSKRMTILDAPGHKNYVPNMIAGASQADVAALVISAKTGEFESGFDKGGQTVEHAMLAKSLGVQELVLLINKMDENTINWSKDRFDSIKRQMTPFLKNACGYDMENNVHWIPISGLNGDNIQTGITASEGSWYEGPTFMELLDNLPVPKRDPEGPVRIPVLDKYKDAGALYIYGKVESGTIFIGQKLTIIPNAESVTIHAIYNDDDKRIPYAKPGEGVKLHVKGVEDDYVNKGDIICSNNSFAHVCNEAECEITITELPEHKSIMSNGYNCVVHLHSALEEIYIKEIKTEYNKTEDKFKPAKYLKSGSIGKVIIATKSNNPLCCEKFDVMPHLGRFTLRDEGKTIAAGKILRVKPLFREV